MKATKKRVLELASQWGVAERAAMVAWALMTGKQDPCDESLDTLLPRTRVWQRQCYHLPKDEHVVLVALDELLGTHGVEYVGNVDMYDGPPVEYLNVGETCSTTILRSRRGYWYVASIGDWIEGSIARMAR